MKVKRKEPQEERKRGRKVSELRREKKRAKHSQAIVKRERVRGENEKSAGECCDGEKCAFEEARVWLMHQLTRDVMLKTGHYTD